MGPGEEEEGDWGRKRERGEGGDVGPGEEEEGDWGRKRERGERGDMGPGEEETREVINSWCI